MVKPDRWVVLEVTIDGTTSKKVFCGDYGGYCGSDTWGLSSDIKRTRESLTEFEFTTDSGNTYMCAIPSYGMSGYMLQIHAKWSTIIKDIRVLSIEEIRKSLLEPLT